MTVSSIGQLDFFLMSILAGTIMGFFYNVLSAIRKTIKPFALISDIVFWGGMVTGVILMGIKFNDGGIRGYQLFGITAGFILHFLIFGDISEKAAALIAKILEKILFPIAFLFRGMILYINKIFKNIGGILTKISKNRKKTAARAKVRKKIQKNYKKML